MPFFVFGFSFFVKRQGISTQLDIASYFAPLRLCVRSFFYRQGAKKETPRAEGFPRFGAVQVENIWKGRGVGRLPEAHQATLLEQMNLLQVGPDFPHLKQQLFQEILGFLQGVEFQPGCLLVLLGDQGHYFRR
jgi:hypothetical protein